MTRRPIVLPLAAIGFALTSVIACEIRVRDSAFRTARDVHKLCVIAQASDSQADTIEQRLSDWILRTGEDLNLEVVRVDADDPETNWRAVGIPSAPPSLPVTVLVGRDNGIGENFLIDHWEPAPSDEQLALLTQSPLRQKLAEQLATNIAVLVFVPQNPGDSSPNGDLLQRIVSQGIAEERVGLSMIQVDRTDPAEKLLCQFIGIRPDSADTVCIAFGRGKLMTPPLAGDQISTENVMQLVTTILQACSCSKPLPTMGVDLPLIWNDSVDASVVLMDSEIDLKQLDEEVQKMLAAKAIDENAEPIEVSIATGKSPEQEEVEPASDTTAQAVSAAHDETSDNAALVNMKILTGLLAVVMIAVVIFQLQRRPDG